MCEKLVHLSNFTHYRTTTAVFYVYIYIIVTGILRRKTVLKKGRKPHVSSWKKFWVQIWGTNILYYPAKNSRASQRSDVSKGRANEAPPPVYYNDID